MFFSRFWVIAGALSVAAIAGSAPAETPPNIVVIFCDDLGYGDLSSYGHPTIRTPHLDRMAAEGQKWTSFYAAAPVCTPSRAALLTGRLPVRSGMTSNQRRVLFPNSTGGMPAEEILISEALRERGYATACIGKWHLGHLPEHLPTRHGFDYYFGIPYSNDMDADTSIPHEQRFGDPKVEYFNVPILRNEEIVERPADQTTITRRFTEEAIAFMRENKARPFFVYLAHNLPHVPLFRSPAFEGRSPRGLYGDVIEEIDWSVGQVLDALREEGLAENTLVLFTSDNGPWLTFNEHGGSAGPLRGGKGDTFEGGMRVPGIFWWPGRVRPGIVTGPGSTLDVFATASALAGAPLPADRVIDSLDLGPALFEGAPSPRDRMFFYRDEDLYAIRLGPWKAHFQTRSGYGQPEPETHAPPLLYQLDHDPGEQYDHAGEHPEVIQAIEAARKAHDAALVRGENQLKAKME